jgi:hypothetical protein
VLGFWLICPLLALAFALLGAAVRAAGDITQDETGPFIASLTPFAVACCLSAVALLAIWEHINRHRSLSDEEKKSWKKRFVVFYPLAAWQYWRSERDRSAAQ